jgi:sterol desaturase/sphingolipid hydroxylase (fatty acid hydroxylase superfamily)
MASVVPPVVPTPTTSVVPSGLVDTLQKEVVIRSIKIVDIAYVYTIYFILGLVGAKLFDKLNTVLFGKVEEESKKEDLLKVSTEEKLKLFGKICLNFALVGIYIYICRNLIELVPFPFQGVYGYDHMRLKEMTGVNNFVLGFTVLYFQDSLKKNVTRLRDMFTL